MQYLNKREKILDAMQQLMTTADTRSITVSEIAQKAGIGKGSIYYYFPSKNDILAFWKRERLWPLPQT